MPCGNNGLKQTKYFSLKRIPLDLFLWIPKHPLGEVEIRTMKTMSRSCHGHSVSIPRIKTQMIKMILYLPLEMKPRSQSRLLSSHSTLIQKETENLPLNMSAVVADEAMVVTYASTRVLGGVYNFLEHGKECRRALEMYLSVELLILGRLKRTR